MRGGFAPYALNCRHCEEPQRRGNLPEIASSLAMTDNQTAPLSGAEWAKLPLLHTPLTYVHVGRAYCTLGSIVILHLVLQASPQFIQ